MFSSRFINRARSISPRAAIVGVLILAVAVSGAVLLLNRGGSNVAADTSLQPRAARIDQLDGSVGIARGSAENQQLDWAEATINTPVTVGDRIYARNGSHVSIALTGHDYVKLNPDASLDVLTLADRRTQLALRSGSALFDVGALAPEELYEVATPCGAVDFREPGLYQVGIDGGNAIISTLNGLARVVGVEGYGDITRGQVFTLACATEGRAVASRLAPNLAGEIVDDYYRYRYPRVYDGRYRSYDAYLADPFFYDPYRTSLSCRYLPADIPGLYDLDYYGDWVDLTGYGYGWAPRVSAGWAPFHYGYWDLDELWGASWVSYEPWGWAPYHYGRWAFISQRWFWIPVEVRTQPVYYPAAVAFIPFAGDIAWVPLAPGEVYVSRYYDVNLQPQYLASAEVIRVVTAQTTFVNFNAPGAVTVVPVRSLTRVIDPGVIAPVDVNVVAKSRAVLDPFSVEGVRQLAIRGEDARHRFKFARAEQEVLNTPVMASAVPMMAARANLAKALKVEAAPEKGKENKLTIDQNAQITSVRRSDGLPQPMAQSQRMAELASRAEQGDKSARREMRQLMREEQQAAQTNQPAAQQEQTKQQRKLERQQQAQAAAQQEAARQAQQQQTRQQRKLERQQQAQAAAQQQAARQAQREQLRQQEQMRQQQMRQQKQEQKPPKQKPPDGSIQQQGQAEQARVQGARQREQHKAQRRAEQQQRAVIEEQNRRAAMQAAQQAREAQAREQIRAQRRAEQQRQVMVQQQAAQTQAAQRQVAGPPLQQRASGNQGAPPQPKAEKQRKPPQ